jgi:hypothetical protein
LETQPFIEDSGRVDVETFWLGEHLLVDVSIVGGNPVDQQAEKLGRYAAAARNTDRNMRVVPAVWSLFGAAGPEASALTRRLARGAAARFSFPAPRAEQLLEERFAATVLAAMAEIVRSANVAMSAPDATPPATTAWTGYRRSARQLPSGECNSSCQALHLAEGTVDASGPPPEVGVPCG